MTNCIKYFFKINKNSPCKFFVAKSILYIYNKSDGNMSSGESFTKTKLFVEDNVFVSKKLNHLLIY